MNHLGALHELRQMQKEHSDLLEQLKQVDLELNKMTVNKDAYQSRKQQVELKRQEIDLLTQRIQRTPYFQLQEKVCVVDEKIDRLF